MTGHTFEADRYVLLGCSECSHLWIIAGTETAQDTVECPSCGKRRGRDKHREIYVDDNLGAVREARTAMLVDRHDDADQFDELDHYEELEAQVERRIESDPYRAAFSDALEDDSPDSSDHETAVSTADPGSGPDVDVELSSRRILRGQRGAEPGLRAIDPGGQLSVDGYRYPSLSPRSSEWLPEILEDLLPETATLVRELADEHRPDVLATGRIQPFVQDVLVDDVAGVGHEADDGLSTEVHVEAQAYMEAIARYAILWADEGYQEARGFRGETEFDQLRRVLETVGSGRGQMNAGLDALQRTMIALHEKRASASTLTVMLDGEAWVDASDDAVERSLRSLYALADAFDVRVVASPGLREHIRRVATNARERADDGAAPEWAQRWLDLTQTGDRSPRPPATETEEIDQDMHEDAWAWVEGHASKTGLLRLLAHLESDSWRAIRDLRRDADIDLASGSVDRYVGDLEGDGLIEVDRSERFNRVHLTPLGRVAQEYVTDDGRAVHPDQSCFGGEFTRSPQQRTSTVYAPSRDEGPWPVAERWMADTGTPGDDASYVQWLGDRNGPKPVEPPELHRRILAGERVKGVNLVDADHINWRDDDLAPDGDGRVTYLSEFDDQLLVVGQWGGAIPTLARIASSLISNKALSRCLSIDNLGVQFEKLHDGVSTFENDLQDVLIRGHQIGWLSEDELGHYDDWRERISTVLSMLLEKMGQLDELDREERTQLIRDLQGLICSATHLYHAAGYEVTFNIRMPDVDQLRSDRRRYDDFLRFIRKTATKQAGYRDSNGVHSIFRMLQEKRSHKLKSRLPYDIRRGDATADLTASWIISGDGATSMEEDLANAIWAEKENLREAILEGDEEAAILELPVVEANAYGHIKSLLRERIADKGFTPDEQTADLGRITRCLEAALSTDDRGPSPFDVEHIMSSLQSKDDARERFEVRDIQNALASLPSERIFPSLPPAARRMLSALFAADGPLSRSDLIDVTSESSYDRHWRLLEGFYLVERRDDGWVAHLEPWWSDANDRSKPWEDGTPEPMLSGQWIDDVLYLGAERSEILWELDADVHTEIFMHPRNIDEIIDVLGFEQLWPILRAFRSEVRESDSDGHTVRIGPERYSRPADQATLDAAMG